MNLRKIIQALGIFTLLSLSTNSVAQVTVGANEAPEAGVLLQLKNKTGITGNSPNSDKGIGMPRVILTDLDKLKPMYSYADQENTPSQVDEDLHLGLMVYNVNKCINRTGNDEGLYVWNGKNWESLSVRDDSPGVSTAKDQDGNVFRYRTFGGGAGTWMLENLKAKTFDPVRDNGEAIVNATILPGTNINTTTPAWAYPINGANSADPAEYDVYPKIGLLYNWTLATNSKAGGNDEVGLGAGAQRQGICPNGWHLPTDKEWTDLENEIITNTSIYSTTPNIGAANILGYNMEGLRGEHQPAMVNPCEKYIEADQTKGTSLAAYKGGLDIVYAGWAANGLGTSFSQVAIFWTSSTSGYEQGLPRGWLRFIFNGDNRQVSQHREYQDFYMSIRCKRNE